MSCHAHHHVNLAHDYNNKSSLQNGICEESAIGFLILGYFKASLEGKYEEGRYWMCVVYKIIENAGDKCTNLESLNKIGPSAISRVDVMATTFLNFFYCPLKQSAFRLLKLYQKIMAIGDIERWVTFFFCV